MARILYELAGRDEIRFSPYCWRTMFALKHKGLEFDRVPMKFTDRACIAESGQDRVPVLDDDGALTADSWHIATYLEDKYPERPSLFGGDIGRGTALMINKWVDMVVHADLRPIAVPGAFKNLDPDDTDWFRVSREAIFGMTLETLADGRDAAVERLRTTLGPVRATIETQPFLCGDAPAYADYILMGSLMWPRCCSNAEILAADDPLIGWHDRMLGLFDGYAAAAPTYAAA